MWFGITNFKNRIFLIIIIVAVGAIIIIVEANSGNTNQELVLYGLNREGRTSNKSNYYKNEKYLANTRNLELISPMIRDGRLKSACVQVGLWAIFYGKHFSNIASILYASSDSNDRTCTQNKINSTHYSSYKSIRYIGNSDLSLPGISLYKGKFFSEEELYFDGDILSLPNIQEFKSYGFTGRANWTLFADQHFRGSSLCLASEDLKKSQSSNGNMNTGSERDGRNKDGIVYNKILKNSIPVGSILKGCIERINRTVIYPNGETIVQWTTKPNQPFEEDKNFTKYLKLYSEFEPDELITDSKELRLPSTHSFPSFTFGPGNEDSDTWTVFSGTEFNGQAKCFYTNAGQDQDEQEAEEVRSDISINSNSSFTFSNSNTSTSTASKNHIVVIGSIKFGCVDPIILPILEQHQLPKLEIIPIDNPSNSLFFISFIIGLIIFIIILIVAIILIIYFYCSNRKRRRRRQQYH